jgi:uncharacterized phage-like protein YoqJ
MMIAGTGHRPDKLGGYGREAHERLVAIACAGLGDIIGDVTGVISGGALGWDQALADAALRLNLPLTMALPFEGFECKWPKESQEFLHSLLNPADVVFVCDPGYAAWKMQHRNKWMVDNCDTVLALWNGTDGGTANCIRYANKVNKPIINLWDKYDT